MIVNNVITNEEVRVEEALHKFVEQVEQCFAKCVTSSQ